jgi:4-amino-4-deoxy-L-arabinose transferase-like glycosyltransferase
VNGVKREALLVAALAVAARLAWVLLVPTHPVGDFAMYRESADYLVAHGSLDPEFIYMPGYVLLLAAARALGGGLLAAKLIGVAAGGLAAAACYGTAAAVFDDGSPPGQARARWAARAAGLLAALWPAGIAVSSVTGTDMPAAALVAAAVWLLVRDGRRRPVRAAALFGLVLGLAATIRAVALPVALLGGCYWLALRVPPRALVARTALGCAVAFLVLLPWGICNRVRYSEFFLTDSHGGHTALVGANPNSEGVYSRSLNRMFAKGTGYALFAPPHRDADREAYRLAKQWAAAEPAYAIGLLGAKADRLLTNERPLLYWPLYRQGVLRGPVSAWFALHRAGIEALVDGFWYALVAAALLGLGVALARRMWLALALVPFGIALGAMYVVFFAEVRYHLAIAVLLFPFAGLALVWLAEAARDVVGRRQGAPRRLALQAAFGVLASAVVFAGWPRVLAAAAGLRARHRFGVCACEVSGRGQICLFRAEAPRPSDGRSPVRGVWDGIGVTADTAPARAAADVELPPGRYRVSALADTVMASPIPSARLDLRAGGAGLASALLPQPPGTPPARISGIVDHPGGPLRLEVVAASLPPATVMSPGTPVAPPTLWLSDIKIEAELR